jgi:hypothetical protein
MIDGEQEALRLREVAARVALEAEERCAVAAVAAAKGRGSGPFNPRGSRQRRSDYRPCARSLSEVRRAQVEAVRAHGNHRRHQMSIAIEQSWDSG